jgi:hypothetical protein
MHGGAFHRRRWRPAVALPPTVGAARYNRVAGAQVRDRGARRPHSMTDDEILHRITQLVEEEHELSKRAEHHQLEEDEHARMRQLEVALDQCWDLLRQRRARREFGQNPDDATPRDANIVEGYKQ